MTLTGVDGAKFLEKEGDTADCYIQRTEYGRGEEDCR